jgi:hypothetical protein
LEFAVISTLKAVGGASFQASSNPADLPTASPASQNDTENAKTPATRAQLLLEEARAAAAEQIITLDTALTTVGSLASEIATGGDIYPAGVRDLCRRLAEDVHVKAQTLAVLARRHQTAPRSTEVPRH